MALKKTTEAELHNLVELIEAFLEKKDKADKYNTSMYKHEAAMARRNLDTAISSYRFANPKKPTAGNNQGTFGFLNHLKR